MSRGRCRRREGGELNEFSIQFPRTHGRGFRVPSLAVSLCSTWTLRFNERIISSGANSVAMTERAQEKKNPTGAEERGKRQRQQQKKTNNKTEIKLPNRQRRCLRREEERENHLRRFLTISTSAIFRFDAPSHSARRHLRCDAAPLMPCFTWSYAFGVSTGFRLLRFYWNCCNFFDKIESSPDCVKVLPGPISPFHASRAYWLVLRGNSGERTIVVFCFLSSPPPFLGFFLLLRP